MILNIFNRLRHVDLYRLIKGNYYLYKNDDYLNIISQIQLNIYFFNLSALFNDTIAMIFCMI